MALPSVSTLQSASFMESVEHAEVVLTANESDATAVDDTQIQLIDAMLETSNGARGFFVTLLSNPGVKVMDVETLPANLVNVIKRTDEEQGRIVDDLLAKNCFMSSSMVIHYNRTGEAERQSASELTAKRSRDALVACLRGNDRLAGTVAAMLDALEDENFERQQGYGPFLKKWGYDAEQRRAGAVLFRSILSGSA